MPNTLSIRSYSRQKMQHSHSYHQLVLPLRGVINIEVNGYRGKVTPGECLVIKAGSTHGFTADTEARFVVADMDELPENISCSNTIVFSITQPLSHFLRFVESQLEYQINKNLEQLSYHLFFEMLGEQRLFKQFDHRIREAVEYIEAHITDELPINELARVACLSPTQFKKLFKEQTGLTAIQYIIKFRMEKAQALLIHTDYPNQIVAEKVGYNDYSAFSRRFSQYFGLPPSKISC
ncbi:helix-turn-helix domain-containing protein [Spongorhabdus nitratireducens]